MDSSTNRATVRRWISAWNSLDRAAMRMLFDPAYMVNGHHVGPEGVIQSVEQLHTIFGEARIAADDIVVEGDRVVLRWTMRGRHRGPFMNIPPTGLEVALTGTNIYRLVNDTFAENWENVDVLGLLRQLGASITMTSPDSKLADAPVPEGT